MLPIEILGIPPTNRDAINQSMSRGSTCPFSGASCIKKNRTCTVGNAAHGVVAICPNRFLQRNLVFQQVADEYFGSRHDLLLFGEVASGDSVLGKFDYVMARHLPISNTIDDFVIVEFQTVDTTNTGRLNNALELYWSGEDLTGRSFDFGLNWANVWKRCFIQILNKGRVLENWGNKAFWVVQEPTYRYLMDGFGLRPAMRSGTSGSTVFMVYDIASMPTGLSVQLSRIESTTIEQLLTAFGENERIPSKDVFVTNLANRARRRISISVNWK